MKANLLTGKNASAILPLLDDVFSQCRKSMEILDDVVSVDLMESNVSYLERTLTSVGAFVTESIAPFQSEVRNYYANLRPFILSV